MRFFIILTIFIELFAIKNELELKLDYIVLDSKYVDEKLYISNNRGSIEVFKDLISIKKITLPSIEDIYEDTRVPKLFSIDVLNDSILILTEGSFYRELYLYRDNLLKKVMDDSARVLIKTVKFLEPNIALLALYSSEFMIFDIEKEKIISKFKIGDSTLSDFMILDSDRLLCSFESGEIVKYSIKNRKIEQVFKGANRDNVYKIDSKNGKIIGAGQDKRLAIYDLDGSYKVVDSGFLIYFCSFSKDGKKIAFSKNENSDIAILDLESLKIEEILKADNSSIVNSVIFLDDLNILTIDDNKIYKWRLK